MLTITRYTLELFADESPTFQKRRTANAVSAGMVTALETSHASANVAEMLVRELAIQFLLFPEPL